MKFFPQKVFSFYENNIISKIISLTNRYWFGTIQAIFLCDHQVSFKTEGS